MTQTAHLREAQERILSYRGGRMGISAVPGSGKTFTLSHLAAQLVLSTPLEEDQEVLIVTFSNSAVNNFVSRIDRLMRGYGIIEGIGYRVRTLHGLANDIIHERPELAGLPTDFQIIDESEGERLLEEAVDSALRANPSWVDGILDPDQSQRDPNIRRKELPETVKRMAAAFIASCKNYGLLPQDLLPHLIDTRSDLLEINTKIYQGYQDALAYRGAVDFNDLIRLAKQCLDTDPSLVQLLKHRWPFVLEDEAQDSSIMQQEILETIVGPDGNWVRVGDPNQSINESFTTANPELLKDFLKQPNVRAETLPESGRSARKIIDLANTLNRWVQQEHPNYYLRDALSDPMIEPTKPGDPQPNPPNTSDTLQFVRKAQMTEEELNFLAAESAKWLEEHPKDTVAILAQTNHRVGRIHLALKDKGLKVTEALLQTPETTRLSAGAVATLINYLGNPDRASSLAKAFEVLYRSSREDEDLAPFVASTIAKSGKIERVESWIYPDHPDDAVRLIEEIFSATESELLRVFIAKVRRWLSAMRLPLDQLILVIAQDLEPDPIELATLYRLSQFVKDLQDHHPEWSLGDLNNEVRVIAKNERRFTSPSGEESGYDPANFPGTIAVGTFHKAKGLEWDKVFLSSLNSFDFPTGNLSDYSMGEKKFLIGQRNIEVEAVADVLEIVGANDGKPRSRYTPAELTKLMVAKERLRLLYVGITRAKKSLSMSWNTGNWHNQVIATAFEAISRHAEED